MDLLGSVSTVAFDKTGTLTIGKPVLTDVITFNQTDPTWLLQRTASVETMSEHPMASAVVAAAERDGLDLLKAEHARAIPGHGIAAQIEGASYVIGNRRLMESSNIDLPESVQQHLARIGEKGRVR